MKVIGLTGSIGSGKSLVSGYIMDKGYNLIDSDSIAHNITGADSPILEELVAAFGDDILDEEGNLNRALLAKKAFDDPIKKSELMDIVTSKIISIIDDKLALFREEGSEQVVFVDAPVLYESGAVYLVDEVWLVIADDNIRAERVMERDNCSMDEFIRRDKNQLSQEEKALMADRLIDNSGTIEELYKQVDYLLAELDDEIREEC